MPTGQGLTRGKRDWSFWWSSSRRETQAQRRSRQQWQDLQHHEAFTIKAKRLMPPSCTASKLRRRLRPARTCRAHDLAELRFWPACET